MPVVTVRNLPEATHRALKMRTAQHGHSTETEIRKILEDVVRPKMRVKIGAELAAFGLRFGDLLSTSHATNHQSSQCPSSTHSNNK